MAKAPAFQLYASDFLTATAEMTNQEVGVYIRLLCYQWINGAISADPKRLAIIVGEELHDTWDTISDKFQYCEDGKLRNTRLEEVRQVQIEYRKRAAESGRKGAKKRWQQQAKDSDPNGNPNGHPNSNPNGQNIALQSSVFSLQSSTSSSQRDRGKEEKPPEKKHFCPPTTDQVRDYCNTKQLTDVNPDQFCDFYESKNWMVGKNKMKSWQAACRNWQRRQKENKTHETNKPHSAVDRVRQAIREEATHFIDDDEKES